jgi:hypothetical protein
MEDVEKPVENSPAAQIKLTKINGYSGLHRFRSPRSLLKSRRRNL